MQRKMNLMEIIHDMAHRSLRMSIEEQAEALNVGVKNFYNQVNPREESFHYRLTMLVPHMRLLDDLRPLQFLASQMDHALLPLPKAPAELGDVQVEMNRVVKEVGDVFQRIGLAVDCRSENGAGISADEAKQIEKEISEAVPQMLALLRAVQGAVE